MTLRRAAGLILLLIAAYLFWQGLDAVLYVMSLGSPLNDALMQPPTSLIRLTGAGLALIGGALATANLKGGAWLAAIGTVIFCLLTLLLAMNMVNPKDWMPEVIASIGLVIATGLLIFTRRR